MKNIELERRETTAEVIKDLANLVDGGMYWEEAVVMVADINLVDSDMLVDEFYDIMGCDLAGYGVE